MKLLVCAATHFELSVWSPAENDAHTILVETGVGIPATLGGTLPNVLLAKRPELILNIGIAGSYPETGIELGDIVLADGEVYGDVGFELPEEPGFRSIAESDFGRDLYAAPLPTVCPPEWHIDPPGESRYAVHMARGCTVNACTGTEVTGELRRRLFGVGIESMEGAAVAQIGRNLGIPVCEIRAISNIAARRDMRPENIRCALENLRHYLSACRRRNSDDGTF